MTSSKEDQRDQAILNRLARIEHKVDALERTQAFALRAEAESHFASVREIFGTSVRKAQVYLAVDGERNVSQLADHLGVVRQNVSRAITSLREEGLVEIVEAAGNNFIYSRTPVDRSLRIAKFLQDEFGLQRDGLIIGGGADEGV